VVKRHRIAVIPARGGSKRLPRKNIIDFCGKPMIVWTIQAAHETALFDRIFVSTDDPEIAETARRHGVDVPFFRDGLADDETPISAVTAAALEQIAARLADEFEIVVQLMPNCPLRTADDIAAAMAAFEAHDALFQVSCVRFGWLNPWWALRLDAQGHGTRLFPEAATKRSQDLDPLYCPTGAVWIARCDALRQHHTFYGAGHRLEPISWVSGVDIDDEDDLALARAAFMLRRKGAGS